MFEIYDVQTEYRDQPLGIDTEKPAFSWKLRSSEKNVVQTAYRVCVEEDGARVWDSGSVKSDQSLYVVYEGTPLKYSTRYIVTVEVTNNYGEKACAEGWFETGLMAPQNFKADWITHAYEDTLEPCAVFSREFTAAEKIKSARLYISALGIYEAKCNDKKVGDAYFAPGWTCYNGRLQYQTYDITELLTDRNRIEVTVANGWYKGILGFYGQGNHYGTRTALIAQLDIVYEDGSRDQICTDEKWFCYTSEVRYADLYNGELIDKTFISEEPVPVRKYDYSKDILTAQESEPVRITERILAKKLITTPKGEKVLDFGQNFSGVVMARLKYPRGTKITIHHAELLDENGNFYTENLRTAKATDVFVCSGEEDVFCPVFTVHGFRYIWIEGAGDDLDIDNFTACVCHTDMRRTGMFSCTNEKVNQLWKNIDWTMRSNFLDIPTDCNQRDERLGYTGDAEIFAPTAAFLRNTALFYHKWLQDVKTEQSDVMGVPLTAPNILGNSVSVAIWHEAAAIVPWLMWETYGDIRFLEDQYDSIKSCVEYTRHIAGENGLVQNDSGKQFGDWLSLDAPKGPYRKQTPDIMYPSMDEKAGGTDTYFIANVYYLWSIDIMAKTAGLLGRENDKEEYEKLYGNVLDEFRKEYVTARGRLVTETQTACALALHFNLVEDKDREKVKDTLRHQLISTKNHVMTGFVGSQFLCKALSENGYHDLAGKVFLQEDCPSWLYSVNLGATTIWELWDGYNTDGSINRFEMNSFNQCGFGAIGDWLHRDVGGLQMLEPGYKKSRIAPRPIKGISGMSTSLETVYGKLSCSFEADHGHITVDIHIPENTTAVVSLPERADDTVGSGDYHYEYDTDLSFEADRYSEETTLGELMSVPLGEKLLREYIPEVIENDIFMTFAAAMSIIELITMLPKTMLPRECIPYLYKVIDALNHQENTKEE
ncbi:alfa-L-rhamnosidase [Ruminococcus sp. AF18-22]|nr:alfa-L-rhamnosidase [Ruminococcus sp. AF18-22]